MRAVKIILTLLLFTLTACSTLTLKPVDFSWPIESVLKVDDDGFVKEDRYSFSFNSINLFLEETGDSLSYINKEIRIIRDMNSYYYITSKNFKHVYVFTNSEGALSLSKKILISEAGISNPAFNQRQPYIELINGDTKLLLSNDGIKE
jgi:hypothetical protein